MRILAFFCSPTPHYARFFSKLFHLAANPALPFYSEREIEDVEIINNIHGVATRVGVQFCGPLSIIQIWGGSSDIGLPEPLSPSRLHAGVRVAVVAGQLWSPRPLPQQRLG